MIEKNLVYQYLVHGCAKEQIFVPRTKCNLSLSQAQENLKAVFDKVISNISIDPQNTLFQFSAGFDSSIIVNAFKKYDIKTFCTGEIGTPDKDFAKKASLDLGLKKHFFISEKELLGEINLENILFDMNKIHTHPRCYLNDIELFRFVQWSKNEADTILGGEGIELLFLGYPDVYAEILKFANFSGEYDLNLAKSFLREKSFSTQNYYPFDFNFPLKWRIKKPQYQSLFNIPSAIFSSNELSRLGIDNKNINIFPGNLSLHDSINHFFDWYGSEYVYDRMQLYSKSCGVNWITPFLRPEFVEFCLSLPIEMRNCMGYPKFLMYQTFHEQLPSYISERKKAGLNLSLDFYEQRYNEIINICNKHLKDKNNVLYDYIDYKGSLYIIKKFSNKFNRTDLKKIWSLLNLYFWLNIHNTSENKRIVS